MKSCWLGVNELIQFKTENFLNSEDFVDDQILIDVLEKSSNAVQTDLLGEDSDSDSDVPLISYIKPSTSSDKSRLRKVTFK